MAIKEMPKKVKFRKVQKGRIGGLSKGARTVYFGEYGLEAVEPYRITAQQIKAIRLVLSRGTKKAGSFFLRIFPDKPVSKKPAETRMGKGKGGVDHWVAVVKRRRILCEVGGVDEGVAKEILKGVSYKLPIKTRFVRKVEVAV
jgi:large subunit ribosomal protein L16